MNYNSLKKADFTVSEVSFGCMSLKTGGNQNDEIIAKAIDGGINLFDTADLYEKGENEKLLGNALKGRRKEVLISTKVGNRWREDGTGWDWCPRKDYILKAIDNSLKRLQTDYIDLYLLHGGTMEDPIDETIEAFERLVDMGKIRSYGLSSIRPNVIGEYVNRSNIAAVMTQYSLLDRRPEEATLNLLYKNNISILARGAVAGGLLADKPAADYIDLPQNLVKEIQDKLKEKSTEYGKTDYETAMRYVLDHPTITTAVAGIRTLPQLNDALAAAKSDSLTVAEREALQLMWEGNTYKEHL